MKKIFSLILITFCFINSAFFKVQAKESMFLPNDLKQYLLNIDPTSQDAELLKAIKLRVEKRAYTLNLTTPDGTTEWWHHAFEYISDASLIYALYPNERLEAWLRANVLHIVRRPMADWAGPRFRGYGGGDMVGALETAHLTWAVSFAYDITPSLFTESEKVEIEDAIRNKGMIPCFRYLDNSNFFHNWNCILFGGLSISAAVLNDAKYLEYAKKYLPVALDHFQNDGSYGESLQYANYAAYGIMIGQESLLRSKTIEKVEMNPYGKFVDWAYYAHLYRKPLSGWPLSNLARSANFGDCASVFRPSGDLLMHIALRAKSDFPKHASLSRWLLNYLYTPANEDIPHDLASFGMINDFGALTVLLSQNASEPIEPSNSDFAVTKAFSGGDAFMRDSWRGKTVIAARIPAEPRHAFAHLHGDVNSFILAFNNERLLVDPGHTCYRNITRGIETSTNSHNTCSFEVQGKDGKNTVLEQRNGKNRMMNEVDGKKTGVAPAVMLGERLLCDSKSGISVIGSDAAALYGYPMKEFKRFIILCGSNAIFVVDKVVSDEPVKITWNWLLNNRDNNLIYDFKRSSYVEAIRKDAGIKITNYAQKKSLDGPVYAIMHDCYQILPAQSTEGVPGSAIMFRYKESDFAKESITVHTMTTDTPAALDSWNSQKIDDLYIIESKARNQRWVLEVKDGSITVKDESNSKTYQVINNKGKWVLK